MDKDQGAAAPRSPKIVEPGPLTKRVATEARRFAMECAAGNAPTLILLTFKDSAGYSCALGWVLRRSGGRNVDPWDRCHDLAAELRGRVHDTETQVRQRDAWQLVIRANNETPLQRRAGAVVFPLLALADALDDAWVDARSAP